MIRVLGVPARLLLSVCAWAAFSGPAAARDPTLVELRSLADGVWLHTSYYAYPGGVRIPSNGLVVQDGRALTLIDTAWGEAATEALLRLIGSEIGLPVSHAVITHYHGDRSAGIDVLEARGIEARAHPLTRRLAAEHGLPVPDLVFTELGPPGAVVHRGPLEILFPGPAHTADNLVVWVPGAGVLFGGCIIRAAEARSAGNTAHGDPDSWRRVLSKLRERYEGARIVVPDHGAPGTLDLVGHTRSLLAGADH